MKRFTFFLFAMVLFNNMVSAQSLSEKLDTYMATSYNNTTPGAAVAIVKDGETKLVRTYGLANLEHSIPFNPNTVADIGSVAKQMTCFAICLLAEDGKLDLDDPIKKYIPNVPPAAADVSIRNLANHTSGIREVYAILQLQGNRQGDGIQQIDAQHQLAVAKALNFPAGSAYSYCNTGYMLLADIISIVSGQEYEAFMQEQIFDPLEMNHSYIMDKQGEIFPNVAGSYRRSDESYKEIYDNSTAYGQGGIYSTIEDMIKWLKNFEELKVGSTELFAKMFEKATLTNGEIINYGLGINTESIRGLKTIMHTGSSAGFRTFIGMFPDHDLGVIIMANSPYVDRPAILDLILDHELKVLPEEEREEEESTKENFKPSGLEKYVGKYHCSEYNINWQLIENGNELILKTVKGNEISLSPISKDVFGYSGFDLQFHGEHQRFDSITVNGARVKGIKFSRL